MRKIFNILFVFVLLIGFFFRFYKLGSVLSGFPTDDAGLGYSAYSILLTGKDEFGMKFPTFFRSQQDFRTPIYAYSIVPFIKFLGVNMLSVRLPSAIFGSLTIIAFYLLVLQLSGRKHLALISAFLLAISPWHIIFSRNAFDSNLALFFLVSGFYLLFKSFERRYLLIFSLVMLAISIAAYRVEQIIVPPTLLVTLFKYKNTFLDKKYRNYLIIGIILGFLICLPLIILMNTPAFWIRANVLGLFSFAGFVADNIFGPWYTSVYSFFRIYVPYLMPRYIIALGDYLDKPTYLELYSFFGWQLPFYVYGLVRLILEKNMKNFKFLILTMLLLFPIPATLAHDPLSPMRALQMTIPQISIVAFGVCDIYSKINKKYTKIAIGVFLILIVYSIVKLYSSIFILGNYYKQNSREWGWQKVAVAITNLNTNLPIIVDNPWTGNYLQLAFFLRYDPEKYQNENYELPLNQYYINMMYFPEKHLGAVVNRSIDWDKDLSVDQYLVGDQFAISDDIITKYKLVLVSEIKYYDGTVMFRIVRTKN